MLSHNCLTPERRTPTPTKKFKVLTAYKTVVSGEEGREDSSWEAKMGKGECECRILPQKSWMADWEAQAGWTNCGRHLN